MTVISIQRAYQDLSLMKTLYTAYQAQMKIQAMRKIFSVRQSCKTDSSSHALSRFNFPGNVGMKACVTNISDPLEYFEVFFTDEIVNHIFTETNIFAAENLNKFKSKEHFRTIIGVKLMRMN
ncbi:piggyBac transposable element-derived protein 4 [Trichonephila inaurata madagascariensis]|uniref:PiggyBac transposable element-derived protein 4 n=1 Tax=Trichonephila inaurata madagascariensis TaxID=2747483 RepID=A0A8X6XFB0_9ARAC|nr:piggyBac transposable element-derived protein 4 [Trichonephila inaurata madagascariensis]